MGYKRCWGLLAAALLLPGLARAQTQTALVNAVHQEIAGAQDSIQTFYLDVPAGLSSLHFITATFVDGEGNADIFVNYEEPYLASADPTPDCASGGPFSDESCEILNPAAGRWYVEVYGSSEFFEVGLAGIAATALQNEQALTISGTTDSRNVYFIDVPPDQAQLTVGTSGGTGNPDLLVFRLFTSGCHSTNGGTVETCQFFPPGTGRRHVVVDGSTEYSGVALLADYSPSVDPPVDPPADPIAFSGGGGALPATALGVLLLAGLAARLRRRFKLELFAVLIALLAGCGDRETPNVETPNIPPTAFFTAACTGQTCQFSNFSTDADGTVDAYAWNFGDGGASGSKDPVHVYAAPGQFTVTLTVTDNEGATTTAPQALAVAANNALPLPAFTVACTELACTFTDQSTDPDSGGAVVSRAWSFGDGQTSAEQHPVHIYAQEARFAVTLTVTDDRGAEAFTSRVVDLPDLSGTYERETPHSALGRHSRYEIRNDGTFSLFDETGPGTTAIYSGQWTYAELFGGSVLKRGTAMFLDFDAFPFDFCGEALGVFLMDGHLAVSYCSAAFLAGLEEGVYTTAPIPAVPGPPPPQAGQIAFVRNGKIHLANSDGTGVVQLTDGPNDHSPAWSADGTRIAFGRSPAETGLTSSVFVMDADGGNVVQVAASGSDPSWSPDGTSLAFSCGGICTVKADGTTPPDAVRSEPGFMAYPAWSPDGTRIAYTSDWNLFDILFDIFVVAPDGSQHADLITFTAEDLHPNPYEYSVQPAWSPDGARIAFAACPWWFASPSCSVSVVDADGSDIVRLAVTRGYASPTWSPDGQTIAYTSANAIEWVSADGLQRGRILDHGYSPAWRP